MGKITKQGSFILFLLHRHYWWSVMQDTNGAACGAHGTDNKCMYACIYFLTPWSRVILETIPSSQLVNKFPIFYGTFLQVLSTFPYHEPDQSSPHLHIPRPEYPPQYYPPIYAWVFQVVFSLRLTHQYPACSFPLPHTCYMSCPFHSSRFDHMNNNWWEVQISKLLIM